MKFIKSMTALVVALAFLTSSFTVVAAEKEKEKKQTCCEKAKAAGKDCTHPCCVSAHKDGKSCEKCNPNKEDQKKEEKKEEKK